MILQLNKRVHIKLNCKCILLLRVWTVLCARVRLHGGRSIRAQQYIQ